MKKLLINLLILVVIVLGFGLKSGDPGCSNATDWTVTEQQNDIEEGTRFDFINGNFLKFYISSGENGSVYTNSDPLNDPWTQQISNTSNNINDLTKSPILDFPFFFACGDNGDIIITPNEGALWFLLNSGTTSNLNAITFGGDNPDIIVAVGDNGSCVRSTNFGQDFSISTTDVTENINGIYAVSLTNIIACCNNGIILRTTNSGADWNSFTISSEDLFTVGPGDIGDNIDGSEVNTILVVGDNGSCYKTTDYVTWTPVETGTTEALYDINFRNSQEGYVAGANGTVRYTTDGGDTWYDHEITSSASLITDTIRKSVLIDDTTVVGVAGSSIYTLHEEEVLLPVELSAFSYSIHNSDVVLNWSTVSELNNSGFQIERSSANGSTSEEWSKIGFVNGHGTVTTLSDYKYTDRFLNTGIYNYRLKQIDFNGNFEYFNLSGEVVIGIPDKFSLSQNFPNPFNPTTVIHYSLSGDRFVSLKIFDISGREVSALVNENQIAGNYEYTFNGNNLSSGVYIYSIRAGEFFDSKKMLLAK